MYSWFNENWFNEKQAKMEEKYAELHPPTITLEALEEMHSDKISRIDIIGQNGNDGLHYDAIDHPDHYNKHPSGVECIDIAEHMGFNLGNALKYVWRCDLKKDAIEDLKKAIWYIERELAKRTKGE